MSTYKLYYFNGRGRAETSRLIFAAAGQKYEDIRYQQDQWPAHKAETPLGQMPVLEFNGTKIPQSISIARFLAKQFNLAGKDNFEQVKTDAVVDTINDLVAAFMPSRREQDETKKQELIKKFKTEELPKHLQNLDTLRKLYGNGGPYFVGNNLTWADLYFYDVGETLLAVDENGLDNYPWLKQNRAEVEKQPKIAEYLKNRPKTPF
jgi:glutathione S-transferase